MPQDDLYLLNPPVQDATVIVGRADGNAYTWKPVPQGEVQSALDSGWEIPSEERMARYTLGPANLQENLKSYITIIKNPNSKFSGYLAVNPVDLNRRLASGWVIVGQDEVDRYYEMQNTTPPMLVNESTMNTLAEQGWTDTTEQEKQDFFDKYANTGYVKTMLDEAYGVLPQPDNNIVSAEVNNNTVTLQTSPKTPTPTGTTPRKRKPTTLMETKKVTLGTLK